MKTLTTNPTHLPSATPWLWRGIVLALLLWVSIDLFVPQRHSIRQFDPQVMARQETAMWRSYYEKKPLLLFWQLAASLRQHFHAPFWRSFRIAFVATKAAFDFKKGHSRADYMQALPPLIAYYQSIQAISIESFSIEKVARLELEWWIIHRQREHYSYNDLAKALAQTAAVQYNQPVPHFAVYGRWRAEAMRLRDESGQQLGGTTETDWQRIEQKLVRAWTELHKALGATTTRS
ncbi:hypothetical protein WBJ53_30400 [Spirosoma sp. SC4-14]|uniref:hypothetical protein n=1 Tax=Spirosoma sp. SC4-14 TaxID=3128900 RepID=UPI0030D42E68